MLTRHFLQQQQRARRAAAVRTARGRVCMAHALESLVFVPLMLGTLLFLHEFLADDDLLAFMVLTTTWSADLFALLYTRTSITGVYVSRLFFAYGAAFHLYALAHPHGFTYSAFATYARLLSLIHI